MSLSHEKLWEQIENISAVQHEIWAEWMKHLFSVSAYNEDGTITIPANKVTRWQRQIMTPYPDLSESEKDSDRKQATKIIESLARSTIHSQES